MALRLLPFAMANTMPILFNLSNYKIFIAARPNYFITIPSHSVCNKYNFILIKYNTPLSLFILNYI